VHIILDRHALQLNIFTSAFLFAIRIDSPPPQKKIGSFDSLIPPQLVGVCMQRLSGCLLSLCWHRALSIISWFSQNRRFTNSTSTPAWTGRDL